MRRLTLLVPFVLAAAACGGAHENAPAQTATVHPALTASPSIPTAPTPGEASVDLEALDKNISPCDDFYQYACGGWLAKTPIPPDQPAWTRSFDVIREHNEMLLKDILEKASAEQVQAAREGAPGRPEKYMKQIGDFYASCMDEAGIEKHGIEPLKPDLARIAKIKDAASLPKVLADMHTRGVGSFFNFDSSQDFHDANQVIAFVTQGGLGLPDRDYYLADTPKLKEVRDKYIQHVENMFKLLGDSPEQAQKERDSVIRVETELAKASMSKVDLRDPHKVDHRMDEASLKALAPQFNWDGYLRDRGLQTLASVNVNQPDFVKTVGTMLKSTPIADVRSYLRWHMLRAAAPRLPAKFVAEAFEFRRALTGAEKDLPRWKKCVRATDEGLGEALGRPFVKETLGEEGKDTTRAMIKTIEAAMHQNLEHLAWMDSETRSAAIDKLSKITNKVGYPDKWKNYDSVEIDRTNYLLNAMNAAAFEEKRDMEKIGKPVDRNEWQMTPPTVNAYYEPSLNEMVFPAGILQSPFYSNKATMPTNYGGIGMVMGHELTHGFDDEGRQFDGEGNLRDWWSAQVGQEFDKRAQCVADQYSAFQPFPDIHVNGKLTLGENIADLGGIKLSLAAMKASRPAGPPTQSHGFTEEQQFFLGFAQGWCTNAREAMVRYLVATNPHSPPKYRVNGPLSNTPEFAEAFSCKPGQPMAPAKRCEVW